MSATESRAEPPSSVRWNQTPSQHHECDEINYSPIIVSAMEIKAVTFVEQATKTHVHV